MRNEGSKRQEPNRHGPRRNAFFTVLFTVILCPSKAVSQLISREKPRLPVCLP